MTKIGNCDVCGNKTELTRILHGAELVDICQPCWEAVLARAGDE